MKTFFSLLIFSALSLPSVQSMTNFAAVIINNGNTLSVTLVDDVIPPFEAGQLWASLKGIEQSKWVEEEFFSMKCMAMPVEMDDIRGSCKIKIPMSRMTKIDSKRVFKLEGPEAARLNRYFNDTAYVSMQRGDAWLSSYNPRRQFFFGLDENLIHR